jgi:multidrug efflux pump subunit AcrB
MTPWALAIHRWQFTLVVGLLLAALGFQALSVIPKQEDPSFPIPLTTIVVVYPGADPVDLERLVVDPIEDAVAEIDDVQELRSTTESGLAVIRVQFDWSTDPDDKHDEVVREVNALRGDLPEGIRDIDFRKANPAYANILQAAIVAPALDPLSLKRLAKDLEQSLESIPGIRAAEIRGVPEPEIRVAVDLPRLSALGIPLDTLANAISSEGANIPGGAVDAGERRYSLKTTGDFATIDEIRDTVIATRAARPLRLADVAEVRWDTEEPLEAARYDGVRAAFVVASMKDGYSLFAVQEQVEARLAGFRAQLPVGAQLAVGFRQADSVAGRLGSLATDFAIALGLVCLTLLPLGLRAAGIVMLAIPLSLALGVAGIHALGFSLNQISIAGFVVALGLLVDDAIVVVENISRRLRDGESRLDAAIRGTGEIAPAVLGCTIVLLLSFLPLMNLPEGPGKFTRGLPVTIVLTVAASLIVALTLVPFLASRALPADEDPHGNRLLQALQQGIRRFYAPVMDLALRWPRRTLLLAGTTALSSLLLVPLLGFELFPVADKPMVLVRIQSPEGASLQATDRALREVERIVGESPAVTSRMASLGRGNPQVYYNEFPTETSTQVAEVLVTFEPKAGRDVPALLAAWRERFARYPDARITVDPFRNGSPVEAPVAIRIVGPALPELRRLAAEAEAILAAVPGIRDVDNPLRLPGVDIRLGLDRDEAGLLGVQSADMDRLARVATSGIRVADFRDERGEEYAVRLRLDGPTNPGLDDLGDLYFTSRTSGAQIPFAQLAEPRLVAGQSQIQRLDRERMVTVTADIVTGTVASKASAAVYAALGELQLPPGYRIVAGGEAEATARSIGGLGTAIIVTSFGILAVLLLEFGSFRASLIVAGVVPFGFIGATVALWITGYPLSYMAIIGLIALVGVETKNSILLVDFTNALRRRGVPLDEAIRRAGEQRFLPVLLTSVTAIGGLLPLALGGSALYSPLAIVMIGGLASSTLLARIVTPVMYQLFPPAIGQP